MDTDGIRMDRDVHGRNLVRLMDKDEIWLDRDGQGRNGLTG